MIDPLVHQRYEVLEKVGDGPLFTVYKARDKVSNRMVALKTVTPPFSSDLPFLQALRAGLSATANLNHPDIAHFYEFGEEDGQVYTIFEFVRGIDLKERIRRIAPFTLSVAIDFICAVVEGLQYAHKLGLAHGDLRPQNIIISQEGAVKITDFGIAQAIAVSPRAQQEILARSAFYHAPELSLRQPGTVGGDLYAVGAILYEMLTGAPPYSGNSPETIADQHAFAPIPSPRAANPGVPRSVEGMVLKCLLKKPNQRYTSATEMLQDLKSVRDALRFGKPLSWSPIDIEKLAADSAAEAAAGRATAPVLAAGAGINAGEVSTQSAAAASVMNNARPAFPTREEELPTVRAVPQGARPAMEIANTRISEPVADVAASSRVQAMPQTNRMRMQDDRISVYIKVALSTVTVIILLCLIGLFGIYSQKWVTPPPESMPQLVGKSIDDVRKLAGDLKINLIEHAQFTADKPRNIVYRTDFERGAKIRAGKYVNVWYSKGQTYVDVPNLIGMQKEDAEAKLKEAGLTLGRVTTAYNDKVATNAVIKQNVSYRKRVLHDTAMDLVISDGPKPDYADTSPSDEQTGPDMATTNPSTPAAGPDAGTGTTVTPDSGDSGATLTPTPAPDPNTAMHTFDRRIKIPNDGKGVRTVKVEFIDAGGLPITIVDGETYDEGQTVPLHFDYQGKKIKLKVYYNDKLEKTFGPFDPDATRSQRIR